MPRTDESDRGSGEANRRLCIVCRDRNAYSETFVRAHIERLPADVSVFSGAWFPHPPDLPHELAAFLVNRQTEAVLAEFGPAGVAVMPVCQRLGIPLTVHFHGVDAHHQGLVAKMGGNYSRLFQSAAAIVAVSKTMVARLRDLQAPADKIYYNPYGVDASSFPSAQPAAAPPVFVSVGRFVDKKAPHLTLLAFREVLRHHPAARLLMIGDGPLLEACRELVLAYRMADAVKFLGVRRPAEVATTLQSARAFVQHSMRTSYGDSEGTPVAVLEAGAAGLPVVASAHAGICDVVVDGETGFLFDEGDIEGMAHRMGRLANDGDLAATMGAAARRRVSCEFPIEKSIDGLWTIIHSTLRGRVAAPDPC